jgi:hypothetical protein
VEEVEGDTGTVTGAEGMVDKTMQGGRLCSLRLLLAGSSTTPTSRQNRIYRANYEESTPICRADRQHLKSKRRYEHHGDPTVVAEEALDLPGAVAKEVEFEFVCSHHLYN